MEQVSRPYMFVYQEKTISGQDPNENDEVIPGTILHIHLQGKYENVPF